MTSSPFICPQAIQKIRAIAPEDHGLFLREMLALAVTDIRDRIEKLDAALRNGDSAAARLEAHSIKGTSLMVGALGMAGQALWIEQEAGQGDPAQLLGICAQLRAGFVPVAAALTEIV